jgi:hypothetical protein
MKKETEKIFTEKLHWTPDVNTERFFRANEYDYTDCKLRMNDFPDEHMWTLFYKGDSIDFDDTPKSWNITYRSDAK